MLVIRQNLIRDHKSYPPTTDSPLPQACCAISGEGVYEGLDWLSREFKKSNR